MWRGGAIFQVRADFFARQIRDLPLRFALLYAAAKRRVLAISLRRWGVWRAPHRGEPRMEDIEDVLARFPCDTADSLHNISKVIRAFLTTWYSCGIRTALRTHRESRGPALGARRKAKESQSMSHAIVVNACSHTPRCRLLLLPAIEGVWFLCPDPDDSKHRNQISGATRRNHKRRTK
jgi:hypothetical protein